MDLEKIRKKYNLKLIILYGSQVTGLLHSKSDFDVAVVKNDTSNYDLLSLIYDLGQYFNTDKIDLSDITHADPLLLYNVMRQGKLLSGSQEDYDELARKAFFKYSDYVPYLDMESDFVKERINSYATN